MRRVGTSNSLHLQQTVVVTGAGGFVCSHIAAGLAASGFKVLGLDQHFDTAARRMLADVECIEGPLFETLTDALAIKPFAVIHGAALTAAPEDCGLTPAAHMATNMDLLFQALRWAEAHRAARFIFISSSGVFDPSDGTDRLDEDTQPTGSSPYAAAKRAGEIITGSTRKESFMTASVRLGHLYGPSETPRPSRPGTSLVASWLAQAKAGKPIGVLTPDAKRDWTLVTDLPAGFERLLRSAAWPAKLYHCGSGEVLSDSAVAGMIATLLPGTHIVEKLSGGAAVKAPMAASTRPPLRGLRWTPFEEGLGGLIGERSAA